jgi:hypothetical protein
MDPRVALTLSIEHSRREVCPVEEAGVPSCEEDSSSEEDCDCDWQEDCRRRVEEDYGCAQDVNREER